MKKKILAFMAIGVMAVSGCGGGTTTSQEPAEEEQMEFGEIQMPRNECASLIPVPDLTAGNIGWENSDGFVMYIAETTEDEYKDYVDACMDAGFTVDYNRGDTYYWADNEDGYSVTVRYEEDGDDVMFIRMDAPEEPSESEEPASEPAEGIDPDFKAALDSYEAFFDEYISFMKKYNESSDASSMLTEYADYMTQYVDTMSKLEDLNTDDLTEEEAAYYAEVSARILKKTAEVIG